MRSRIARGGERLLPRSVRERRAEERRLAQEAAKQAASAEAERRKAEARAEKIAARRQELLAGDDELRTVTVGDREFIGRVVGPGRTVERFTSSAASAHNLDLVVSVLEEAGIEHFLVPSRSLTRHVIGVRLSDRKAVLSALRETYRGGALYAARSGKDSLPDSASLYADGALGAEVKRARTIRFGELLLGPDGQLLADLDYACEIEFWRDGAELLDGTPDAARRAGLRTQTPPEVLETALVAPRPNPVTEVLPADARTPVRRTVGNRSVSAYAEMQGTRLEEIDFPIDIVYTWVDGDDPELRRVRDSYREQQGLAIASRETGASRYISRDELKYSLRSLEMYGDFVRHVYIVTDGQTPSWLNTTSGLVTVVDHKEIFQQADALPVFNSHAIATQLHHIPGLSERYLYFNDDVFLGRKVSADLFFHGNGIAKLPFSPVQIGIGAPHPEEPAPNSAGKNVRELLLKTHDRLITQKFKHTPHPQIRSVMLELEERFAEDVERTSRSRFRSTTDISMGASLHHHYAYLTGRAVPGVFNYRYVGLGEPDMDERLDDLLQNRAYDLFCVNDVDIKDDEREAIDRRVTDFLEAYFPFPSAYER
ncbi:stealth family protein [Streptomyces alkaliterrae]|uniref:Stealth family protein n=1 Tax=Streptomyces alkaliterrae TaxID=2213162 RepID=A0A5P0YMP5_9ACTN|nr:stealth family protein [Streptomyces alkaliterrae]MBB1260567.1 stealth family protein [Streptomyces alkaliterrae]MQS01566.1 sugar phosphotransferase [Streptomyces alkaliterrae]